MTKIRLSATSIGRFKACPTKFRWADVEGLRMEEDADALRIGTNWHGLQEVYRHTLSTTEDADAAWAAAIDHLNERYSVIPASQTPEAWAVERESLVALFIGHLWHWENDDLETVVCEIKFELPLHHPKTGLPLSVQDVTRLGKIDRIVIRNGVLMLNEYKTTGSDVSPGSPYWDRVRLNTQVSFYDLALHDGVAGEVEDFLALPDLPIGGCLYDVVRKPTIRPKMLTQADTAAFLASGEYCGDKFDVAQDGDQVTVDGWAAEVKAGKQGTAIRETPGMFRSRLVADIMERPEHYYARQEVPCTQKERRRFRGELYAIYRSMRYSVDSGHFFHNENECDSFGGCEYRPICHHAGDDAVIAGQTPPGMKRIFTDLTIDKKETA